MSFSKGRVSLMAIELNAATQLTCERCGTFTQSVGWCADCEARGGPIPWQDRNELGVFGAMWRTARDSVFSSRRTLSRLRTPGTWTEALGYGAALSAFSTALIGVVPLLLLLAVAIFTGRGSVLFATALGLALVIGIAVLVFMIASTLWAALDRLALRAFGAEATFENTYRAATFSAFPVLYPLLTLVLPFWMTALVGAAIHGVAYRQVHRLTLPRALGAAFVWPLLFIAIYAGLGLLGVNLKLSGH